MGGGWSESFNTSYQEANASITQQYSGTCDVQCNNTMNNVGVDLVNTTVGGGVYITQICTANGTCVFNNTMDATSDVMFKAANSSNANNVADFADGTWNVDISKNYSYQYIQQSINQAINQYCKVISTNQMNNVQVFAANSTIGGDIVIGQEGTTNGNCQLNSSMRASEYASGSIDNCASSGKSMKKCGAGKGAKSKGSVAIVAVVAIIIFIMIIVISKFVMKPKPPLPGVGGYPTPIKSASPTVTPTIAEIPTYVTIPNPATTGAELQYTTVAA